MLFHFTRPHLVSIPKRIALYVQLMQSDRFKMVDKQLIKGEPATILSFSYQQSVYMASTLKKKKKYEHPQKW